MTTRRRLIILGAGDFAPEVLWAAGDIPEEQRDWEIYGLIDDNPKRASERLEECGIVLPVIGTIADYQPQAGDCFFPAIASTKAKLAICGAIRERGGEFINIIHPTAGVAQGAVLGTGILLWRHSMVSVNTRIGDFVTILPSSHVGHDAKVADGCTISAHCDINGHARLERGVFMGSHAVVLPHAQVEEFAIVGAGSVVLKRVKAGQTVFGVPAKSL